MIEDSDLLRRYTEDGSQPAFTGLVERHLNLVYSAALRQVNGNAHQARDICQTVFADLARKAATLRQHTALRGWLYTSTHFAAAKTIRAESRRKTRETEAFTMQNILADSTPEADWTRLRPVLDGAMHELCERERETVLLRFFDKCSFTTIGEKLGVSENAARKNVERALEKLAALLARRGVSSTTAALAIALTDQAVTAAPSGLVTTITGAAIVGAAGGGGGDKLLQILATTKLKIGIVGVLAAGAGIMILQHRSNAVLANKIGSLREHIGQTAPGRTQKLPSTPHPSSPKAYTAASAESVPVGELRLASTWKNVGRATPAAFIETYWWSIKEMNLDAFITTWDGIDDAGKQMAQEYFDTLPDETRAQYGTAERLIAKLIMWAMTVHPIAGFQVTAVETLAPGDVDVHVRVQLPNGEEQTMKAGASIHQSPDGWRSGLLPAQNVQKALYGGRYLLKFENLPSPASRTPRTQP